MSNRDPSKERLLELFEYKDGILFNRTTRGRRGKKGARVGTGNGHGYLQTRIDGKQYVLHRLIYIMHNGDIEEGLCIDHIDGDPSNNRIDNLRKVTLQENQFNRPTAKGYYWQKAKQKYHAKIFIDGKAKFLGLFDLEEDAAQAYRVAKEKLHIIEKR
jgi:hypothetical protein